MQATATQESSDVRTLLAANRAAVDALGDVAPDMSEVGRLRFALAFPELAEAREALQETVRWRDFGCWAPACGSVLSVV